MDHSLDKVLLPVLESFQTIKLGEVGLKISHLIFPLLSDRAEAVRRPFDMSRDPSIS